MATKVATKATAPAPEAHKLHKLLAQTGLGSRRAMETLVEEGQVTVNGVRAVVGTRVGPDDVVRMGRRVIRLTFALALPRVLLYHKPEGEIVSREDPQGRPSVFDKLPRIKGGKWIAIGRLDFNSSGLLLFTTSGDLANRLMHPRFEIEREYAVRVMGQLSDEQKKTLTGGVTLDDGSAHFDAIADEGGEGSNHWYRVVIKEGRNREVRRLFEAVGLMVSRLMRVRYGIINLPPRLKRGKMLELQVREVETVLGWTGMDATTRRAQQRPENRDGATWRPRARPQGRPARGERKT